VRLYRNLNNIRVRSFVLTGAPFFVFFGPRSPIGRGPALNVGQCRFEACRGYALVAQLAEAAASRAACCRFESCAAHQTRCSLRQAAKASGLHPDIRRFESVREHQSNSKHASESEKRGPRPITAWPEHFQEKWEPVFCQKMRPRKKMEGQYLPLAPIRTRSLKPEWRGSGLLTRRHVDRNHSRPPWTSP
jgi:hypothetical protein